MTAADRLFDAVCEGKAGAARKLLQSHPKLVREEWPGGGGASYLHLAASEGQTAVCEVLVEAGLDVNVGQPGDNNVPLYDAAVTGHAETVDWLLARGAVADGRLDSWSTPLMGAAMEGHVAIAEALLKAGADVQREHLQLPQTALDFAELYKVKDGGQQRVAALLRLHGAIRPYAESHDFDALPARLYLEHIERALGGFVSPLPVCTDGAGLMTHSCRIPKRYDHRLVFTSGNTPGGREIALCLPATWPLHRAALAHPAFALPIDWLMRLRRAQQARQISLEPGVPVAGPAGMQPAQWLPVLRTEIEAEREGDPLLALTWVLAPMPDNGKPAAIAKLASAKWEKLAPASPPPQHVA